MMKIVMTLFFVLALAGCDSQSVSTSKETGKETSKETPKEKPEETEKPEKEEEKPAEKEAPKEAERELGVAPPDVAGPPADASQTESGVSYKVLKPGDGDAMPSTDSTVTVHYQGWTTDGTLFDSSLKHGKPFEQRVGNLIKGWQVSITTMKKGEKRRMWIPAKLGYANSSNPDAPKGMLVFEVELIDFK